MNAWDDVPEIGRYVDGLQKHRRGKSQGSAGVLSPGVQPATPTGSGQREKRGSFKLTDFPTEVERPSLPVTPAPIHRGSYWGEDAAEPGDEKSGKQLPMAEGVPAQSEWVCVHGRRWSPSDCLCEFTNMLHQFKDPAAQLQKLAKQQSDMLLRRLGGEEGGQASRDIPTRSLPFGSEDVKPSTFVARTTPGPSASAGRGVVHSPRPVKGEATTSLVRNIGGDDQYGVAASSSSAPVPGTAAAPTLRDSPLPKARDP